LATVTVILRLDEKTGEYQSVHEAYLNDNSGYTSDTETKEMNNKSNGSEYVKVSFDPKEIF